MSKIDVVRAAMVEAMKAKDKERKDSLSMLLSALKNAQIDKREAPLTEDEENAIVKKEIKQVKETIETAPADRADIIDEAKKRLAVYQEFAPADMTEDLIRETIAKVLAELGIEAPTAKDKGKIMKSLMPLVKGKADGKRALGYTCYFMPEVLLDLPGCFAVRLRAPKCTSPDMATYYMSSRTCHYGRSLFERALEGGYNFLDADFGTETCTVTCRFQEHLGYMDVIQNPDFFVTFTDVPFKRNQNSIEHYEGQLQAHVLDPLHEKFGIDISDEALMKAIDLHNEISAVINEIGDYRKLDNPTITGYEFHVIQLCSQVCPKDLILPMLKETAKELKTRKPDKKSPFRCKVVLAGSENDDPEFTKLIEGCGAEVVCDRYCYGAVESRMPIEVKDGEKPLTAIARHYLETSNCPRFMPQDIMRERKQRLADLAKEYHADGIIVASNKFCEYWSYERTIDTIVLPRDFGYPVCSIEKEYINSASGQLRTRFQAFVESIEIKKIQEGK